MTFEAELESKRGKLVSLMCQYGQSRDDAQDLAQAALIRAWESRETFNETCPLVNWLCRICTRLMLDKKRNEGRRLRPVSLDAPVPEMETGADYHDAFADPHDAFRMLASEASVQSFLQYHRVTDLEKMVLFADESDEALGVLLGVKTQTVRSSRRSRLRRRLAPAARALVT